MMLHFDAHHAATFPAPFETVAESDIVQTYVQAVQTNPLGFFQKLVHFIGTIDSGE